MRRAILASAGVLVLGLVGCIQPPGTRVERRGDEIVAGGQFFHTGTPVVLWLDPKGYDAYRCRRHFDPQHIMPSNPVAKDDPNRYNERGNLPAGLADGVKANGWTLENVQQAVDQFVIHYDVCGTSRQCFKVLHDLRGLSVQFMLDVDGTIYQTLDLKERAWHAGTANSRSIGVEIAHIGAYSDMKTLEKWYAVDAGWPRLTLPDYLLADTGFRTPNFVGYPARSQVIKGTINKRELMQYDYTNEQYRALIKLTAALSRVLPKMRLDVPRDATGEMRRDVLSKEELEAYSGLLGHHHITSGKVDPGPAFDWDRVLDGARRERGLFF